MFISMANARCENSSLDPLHKTLESLKEIGSAVLPFLRLLKDDDNNSSRQQSSSSIHSETKKKRIRPDNDVSGNAQSADPSLRLNPHRRAEAEAAVALAIGTLRYMGARLRGLDRGRKKGDPLRMELDKIRGMLVALRKLERSGNSAGDGGNEGTSANVKGDLPSTKKADATTKPDGRNNSAKRRKGSGKKSGASEKSISPSKKQRR